MFIYVLFYMSAQKIPFIAVLTGLLKLGKIQDGRQDGVHCWGHHMPPAASSPIEYASSC